MTADAPGDPALPPLPPPGAAPPRRPGASPPPPPPPTGTPPPPPPAGTTPPPPPAGTPPPPPTGTPPPPPPGPGEPPPPPPPAGTSPSTDRSAATTTPHGHDDELADLLARISDEDDPVASAATPAVGAALTSPVDASRPTRPPSPDADTAPVSVFEPEPASFGARALGVLIDGIVLAVMMVPGMVVATLGSTALILLGVLLVVAGFVGTTTLYGRSVATSGQWLGNRVASTKVVDVRNGRFVDGGTAGLRFVIRFLVSPILLIGFLMAFTNPQRRTFHDHVAGTVVTRPPRATWSIDDDEAPLA